METKLIKKGENQIWILILAAFNSWSREYFGEKEKVQNQSSVEKKAANICPNILWSLRAGMSHTSREDVGFSRKTVFGTTWQRMVDNLSSVQFQDNDNNWSQKH